MEKKKKKKNGIRLVACLDCLMIINVVYLDDLF